MCIRHLFFRWTTGQLEWYRTWDSNPYLNDFESFASAIGLLRHRKSGRSDEIRTHTGQSLKLLPLPIGLQTHFQWKKIREDGLYSIMYFMSSSKQLGLAFLDFHHRLDMNYVFPKHSAWQSCFNSTLLHCQLSLAASFYLLKWLKACTVFSFTL